MIGEGDTVQCVRAPAEDPQGRPHDKPVVGEVYTVTEVYPEVYGLGCKLEGLNPSPYKGYVLRAIPENSLGLESGWYFRRLRDFRSLMREKQEMIS